jgi:hypothetical protein
MVHRTILKDHIGQAYLDSQRPLNNKSLIRDVRNLIQQHPSIIQWEIFTEHTISKQMKSRLRSMGEVRIFDECGGNETL